ncbi:MAG: low molecular weight phosphatase family protein [Alcanivorax sp.]|nr:low molecular weight phosphatase family protein [Alcanivorax sp.]
MQLPLRILFLCTGNSCRSIIAEGLANHLGEGRIQAFSAGSQPTGKVNAHALAVLARHDVPMANPTSDSWDAFEGQDFDLVITVCDNAAGESCPVWLGQTLKAHWGVPDPAHVEGDQAVIDRAFELTYQQMHCRITRLLSLPLEEMAAAQLAHELDDIQRRCD